MSGPGTFALADLERLWRNGEFSADQILTAVTQFKRHKDGFNRFAIFDCPKGLAIRVHKSRSAWRI